MDKKQTFSLWYVLAALVGMILLQEFFTPRHTQTLPYGESKQAVVAGKLDDVVIADGIATGKLRAEGLDQILPKEKLEALKRTWEQYVTGERDKARLFRERVADFKAKFRTGDHVAAKA